MQSKESIMIVQEGKVGHLLEAARRLAQVGEGRCDEARRLRIVASSFDGVHQ